MNPQILVTESVEEIDRDDVDARADAVLRILAPDEDDLDIWEAA